MSDVAQKIFEKNNISVDVKTGLNEEEIESAEQSYKRHDKMYRRRGEKNDCFKLI